MMSLAAGRPCTSGIPSPPDTTTARPAVQCCAVPFQPTGCTVPCTARRCSTSATRTVMSCVLLRANAAVASFTTPLPLPRVLSAQPGTLVYLPCFSTLYTPERGCAAGGRHRRCCAGLWLALRLRLPPWSLRDRPRCRVSAVAARRHHRALSRARLRGGLEIRSGGIWTRRKCFAAPVLPFGTT